MPPTEYRPKHLEDMVGNKTIRQRARVAVGAALQRGEPLPHTLLTSAGGGLGKTTFATILSNEMYSPIVATTGQCVFSPLDLRNILFRMEPNTLLFIDEFHGAGRAAKEELLLVLESGVLNVRCGPEGTPVPIAVPPFTLIAASTNPELIADPLLQRFGLHFHFDFYSVPDLQVIVERIFDRFQMQIEPAAMDGIARCSCGVPRIALRRSERVRDLVQARGQTIATLEIFQLAMNLEGIDGLGCGEEHRQVLRVLASSPRPVSARNLALALGVGRETILSNIEPLLARFCMITIGAGGRRITDRGRSHLEADGRSLFAC